MGLRLVRTGAGTELSLDLELYGPWHIQAGEGVVTRQRDDIRLLDESELTSWAEVSQKMGKEPALPWPGRRRGLLQERN